MGGKGVKLAWFKTSSSTVSGAISIQKIGTYMSSVSLPGDLFKKHYPTFYSMEAGWGIETNVDELAGVIDRSILHPLSKQTNNKSVQAVLEYGPRGAGP